MLVKPFQFKLVLSFGKKRLSVGKVNCPWGCQSLITMIAFKCLNEKCYLQPLRKVKTCCLGFLGVVEGIYIMLFFLFYSVLPTKLTKL